MGGGAIDRLGHAFNHKVADQLKALGLQAEPEFLMTRLGGAAKDGDVDTLAWNSSTGDVFIIKCKRLLADKTVGEIAERLVEFGPNHIERNGKRGPTRRHLDRVEILRGKLPQLGAATGISQKDTKLRSCLALRRWCLCNFSAKLQPISMWCQISTGLKDTSFSKLAHQPTRPFSLRFDCSAKVDYSIASGASLRPLNRFPCPRNRFGELGRFSRNA